MTDAQDALLDLVGSTTRSVLATLKRDGRPQLSNVTHHYDPERRLVRVSVTADRAKARNLERDPRASLHVTAEDFWSWAVVEGDATLSPVAGREDDATVEELVDLYRALAGEHPDWDDYRRAMVRDRRRVVRLPVGRVYGQPPQ
ncbi:PPOX class F420-dependent oxidoreductase [Kineococcus radiotolerans]|uniref:Pyridoxamine 5'-phosphate oxidase-related FMN-binding n=1 Tax=Kineococcus radiotolerans (strain ATCC BAA-149 / DSM 14245 / SRS30216) TaxID=266940 RepID=A6W434_KINRD|nr:PPOX class F420-dependent oxidoreductase [Kineococcus radiotolerans]ABS01573.1 pyridoxamine 5'-phosphate oxidase-related FMN-binding [Kineococcus radiotolerans SRS30216 = ATCC BAA-149]